MRLVLTVAAAALLAVGVSACGEKSQVVVYKQGKYQGKPDGRPWDNDPPMAELRGGKWNKYIQFHREHLCKRQWDIDK